MNIENIKKATLICRIIAVVSILVEVIVVIFFVASVDWLNISSAQATVICQIPWGVYLISMVVLLYFKQKEKSLTTENRIKQLEDEIKHMKNK